MQIKQLLLLLISLIFFLFFNACEDENEHKNDIANIVNNKSGIPVEILNISPNKYIQKNEKILIEFSQNMDKNSFSALSVTLKNKEYKSEIEIELNSSENKLHIIPIKTLQTGKYYTLYIKKSLKDIYGNSLQKSHKIEFLCVAIPSKDFSNPQNNIQDLNISIKNSLLSSGEAYSISLQEDASILGWGENEFGQTTSLQKKKISTPQEENTHSNNWKSISAGAKHSNAIKEDGTLWSWGKNDSGELGDGTNISSNTQVQEATQSLWLFSSAGENHTLAIKNDATLWAWGDNYYGQLGDGTRESKNTPIQISDQKWKTISAGKNFSIAIQADGTLWAWGDNEKSQLGIGEATKNRLIPTKVQ